jgi:translation elongation factor EF-4
MESRTEVLGLERGPGGAGLSASNKVRSKGNLNSRGSHGSFNPNQVGATIRASNSEGFVETSEEALDADRIVITATRSMETDAADGTASIKDNKTTHAGFQQNLLEQKASKFVDVDIIVNRDTDDELSEITDGREEMTSV